MTIADANSKIAEKVVKTHKTIEHGVVSGYKKVEDKFVDKFLRHDGETVEEAKDRLKKAEEERKAKANTKSRRQGNEH